MTGPPAALDSLRGLALGDCFGQTWFRPLGDLPSRRVAPGPWPWTDDTAMALVLHRVLVEHGEVDRDALAAGFAAAYARDPHRHYGASMHDVLAALGAGVPWRAAAGAAFGGAGSWGNGAAMRVAPLGAWFADDLDRVAAAAVRSAEVTHAHPEGAAGAVAVALAAAVAAGRDTPGEGLIPAVLERVPAGRVRDGLLRAARVGFGTDPRNAGGTLGTGRRISAADTVPFALWCAARHLDDLVEALWATAAAGGDVDTTCAVVGGVVAARTGLDGVPADWLDRCEPVGP